MDDHREHLESLARSGSATRQARAAQALRDEQPDFAVPLLQHLLLDGRTIRVMSAAAASLGSIGTTAARAVLVQALRHQHDWVRLLAAEQLAMQGDPQARPVLAAALKTDDVDQFGHAVDGLCRYRDTEARQELERAAEDSDAIPFLREVASNGLADIGTHDSLPALRSAAQCGNASTRSAAERAVAAIERRAARAP